MEPSDKNIVVILILENKLRSFRIGKHTEMSPKTTGMMSVVLNAHLPTGSRQLAISPTAD